MVVELFTQKDDERPVYLTGDFNHWHTRDERFRMKQIAKGRYAFIFEESQVPKFPLEYKYTKGSWEDEELAENGHTPHNRTLNKHLPVVQDFVPRWRGSKYDYKVDLLPIVEVISDDFDIPELRRKRSIGVLLPHGYYKSKRNYPVLYLQDGQNLIDPNAPYGCWKVDQQLALLAEKGYGDLIVVAIDHGGKDRIREYVPFNTERWGMGEGKKYVNFLTNTLKPYIDKRYRTLPDRLNTGVGGSSLGGLISIYAGLLYPDVFSKLMIFSPSLWLASKMELEAMHYDEKLPSKIYLYGGVKESNTMVEQLKHLKVTLEKKRVDTAKLNIRLEINQRGLHNEARWGKEFPKAVKWLFG
ncbi:MAG: alpha/beta hydrolase [Sphingobacteriales bacterium]|nr:alpha/beta hydrolase [Sphingobacteriales bacterium]